jgi:hypothetical protein
MAIRQVLENGSSAQVTVFCAVFTGILVLVAKYGFCLGRITRSLPPGPPGEFLLGHLRVIPTFSPEYAFVKRSKQYRSDILSFNVLGQPVIVLNSVQAAVDLLDKKGANFCDRPRFVLFE